MADKTRRELLAEAFDASEKDDDEEVAVLNDDSGDAGSETGSDGREVRNLRDSGEGTDLNASDDKETSIEEESSDRVLRTGSAKKTQEIGKKPAPTEAEKQEAEAARLDADGKPVKESAVTDKAPNSWKPATREHWAKIPAEARAEITRREKEVQVTLSQTANVRKFAGDFANVIQPFSHLIRAQNSTPLHAVQNLMTTAAGLMTGNDTQKAAIVSEIIQNYGVDITELDNILSAIAEKNGGKVPKRNGAAPQEHVPMWAKPLIDQNTRFQKMQEQHENQLREVADEEISKVENEPFFEDLREDIADIMEISANRGRKMTVADAYKKAVQLNPEISKLVTQRNLASRANGSGRTSISRARRAASTIAGSPSGKIGGKKTNEAPVSRREQLAQAWDDATE